MGVFQENKKSAEKTRQKIAAEALQRFTTAQNDRWKIERQWFLNLAFFFGQHYVKFRSDHASRRYDMYVPPAPYYKVRPVINHVRKVCRKEIARLTSQKPNAFVLPASLEDRDIFAAQAAEQIWNSLWRQLEINAIVREAAFWQTICGNGFIKQFWNPNKVDYVNNMEGDLEVDAITPFHIFVPDLKETKIEGQPFVVHAQIRDKDWVKLNLNEEVSGEKLQRVDEALYSALGINHQAQRSTAIVLEFWVKPGFLEDLPNGGMFTILNNRIIQGWDQYPFKHNEFPFSKLDAIPTGKFYNDSIIVDLIPVQKELNRTRGQIIENKNLMAKPRFMAEEGSMDPTKVTSEPGQTIIYRQGMNRPEPLPAPNLPGYVENEVSRLYTDISDLSGQHEVSQGQTPPGVSAAVAISYLQEQDESLMANHYTSLEEGIAKTGRQCLFYVKENWDEPRTVRITGVDSTFDVQAFRGSQLKDNTDLQIEGGSALPQSKAAKQAFIMDLMKMGFIAPERGLEVLEVGGLQKIYERIQVDQRQAQRENLKMRVATQEDIAASLEAWSKKPEQVATDPDTGLNLNPPLVIPVNPYDNHAVHIEEHNRFRKTQAFEMLPSHTKQLFEMYVNQHMKGMAGQAGPSVKLPQELMNPLEASNPEQQMQMEQEQQQGPGQGSEPPMTEQQGVVQ